jgi:type VI secretion system secreted protein Hcp
MSDVLVTNVAMSVAGDESTTAENVSLQLAKVDLEYRTQKPDGSLEPGLHFIYDIKANKAG